LHAITDETAESDGAYDEGYNPPDLTDADLTDADAYEDLLRGDSTPADPPDQHAVEDLPGTPEAAEDADQTELGDQPDTADQEMAPGLVVDVEQFPFGNPGASIPGRFQGSSAYETMRETHTDNPWAPFSSQLDWEVARWAKMRSRTSTAVTELLAIPGVGVYFPGIPCA
jgi:hypothetical protein